MSRVNIKIKKTHVDAQLPRANNVEPGTGDTGFDLTAVETVKIPAFDSKVVPVGLTLADIDPGYWIRIEPRSGLGFKHSIQPHLGVIDNGYRGDLAVKLYNFNDDLYTVKKGDKIAQLVVYPLLQPVFEFSDDITDTARGDKGFGSSDLTLNRSGYGHLREKLDSGEWVENPMKVDEGDPDYIPNPDYTGEPSACNSQGKITKDGDMWTYKDEDKILISSHESDKKFMERMVEKDQKSNDN